MRSLFLTAIWLGCGLSAAAQEKEKPSYEALLGQVKKVDPRADFQKLRMAFTQTAAYNPYDLDAKKKRERMFAALGAKEYAEAARLTEQTLATRYVDIDAHYVAYRAYMALGKSDQAKLHRFVFDGLVQSILKSGDGKTPATAYQVIATDEEYAVLGVMGLRVAGQALMGEKGKKIDRMDVVDNKGNKRAVYFDVTGPFAWLERQFKKDK